MPKSRYIPSVYKEVGVTADHRANAPRYRAAKHGTALSKEHERLCKPGVYKRRKKSK